MKIFIAWLRQLNPLYRKEAKKQHFFRRLKHERRIRRIQKYDIISRKIAIQNSIFEQISADISYCVDQNQSRSSIFPKKIYALCQCIRGQLFFLYNFHLYAHLCVVPIYSFVRCSVWVWSRFYALYALLSNLSLSRSTVFSLAIPLTTTRLRWYMRLWMCGNVCVTIVTSTVNSIVRTKM